MQLKNQLGTADRISLAQESPKQQQNILGPPAEPHGHHQQVPKIPAR